MPIIASEAIPPNLIEVPFTDGTVFLPAWMLIGAIALVALALITFVAVVALVLLRRRGAR